MEGLCQNCRTRISETNIQRSFFFHFIRHNFHISCARILLRQGASANIASGLYYPLYEATLWNNYEEVRFLLFEAKADVNCLNGPNRRNALAALGHFEEFSFCQSEKIRIARLLIEQGIRFQQHIPYNYYCYRYRDKLAFCRLTQRALEIALKKRGVHKDVIPIVVGMVWSTRVDAEWRGCNYE